RRGPERSEPGFSSRSEDGLGVISLGGAGDLSLGGRVLSRPGPATVPDQGSVCPARRSLALPCPPPRPPPPGAPCRPPPPPARRSAASPSLASIASTAMAIASVGAPASAILRMSSATFMPASSTKQFQEKCEAVFRPELRKNKKLER